jgi:hypothetical protein
MRDSIEALLREPGAKENCGGRENPTSQAYVRLWEVYANTANDSSWPACRRIGVLIADAQHENPRGVGKGRLLTPSSRSRISGS